MFCHKCGNEIQENQKYCAKCGCKIDDGQNIEVNNIPDMSEAVTTKASTANTFIKKVLKNKKLLIILGVVIVLIIGIIINVVLASNKDNSSDKNNNSIGDYGTSNNADSDNTNATQQPENKEVIAFISSVSDISDGVAKATLETEDGKSYDAIIDIDGNVRYICEKSEYFIYAPTSENDIGCIGSENSSIYKLINAKGEVIKICDGSEFDELVAFGNGYALAYKYEGTIDSEKHLYGIIDNKGDWTVQLTDYGFGQQFYSNSDMRHDYNSVVRENYIGSDIFDISGNFIVEEHMLLNAATGKVFWVYFNLGSDAYDVSFKDGVHYANGSDVFVSNQPLKVSGKLVGGGVRFGDVFIENGDSLYLDLFETTYDFALYPDGTWETISDYPAMNGYEKAGDKWTKIDGDYITIYDYDTKTSAKFTDYKSSMVSGINFEGDYSLVKIEGVDQKSYFTVIDSKGNMQFDPIIYGDSFPKYSSGKVVYQNTSGQYIIADTSGKIISDNLSFDYINQFNKDIAEASKNGKICFINSKGEVLLYEIKLPSNIS